ncbi:MAG: hypothetical protein AAFQ63_05760 [Cyanobacteria bacterium J06621_11]
MPLPSRLLLVAIASISLCSSCRLPETSVTKAADIQPTEPQPETSEATTQPPTSVEDSSNSGTTQTGTTQTDSTQAGCDVIEQLAAQTTETTAQAIAPNTLSTTYTVIGEQEEPQYSVTSDDMFRNASLPSQTIDFDELALLNVLKETRRYFSEHGCEDPKVLKAGVLGTEGISVTDVITTLDFLIETLATDISADAPTRLKDPNFINQNFKVIRWLAYDRDYLNDTRARITKYAVFTHAGSRERTDIYNTPVYKIKDGLENEAFITRYTKQEALSGIFEPGGSEYGKVETLAYLTREGFEDALLQGTALIELTDGSTTYFNVDKNNGIAYVPGLAQPQQERFWYFREVNKLNGYGLNSDVKIPIEPGVTFAGDVLNIGLGKLVAIEDRNQNIRLGLIADTGGAFLPNLHQLDFFAGVFPDRPTYQQAVQQLPEYTKAYFLLKK